LIHVCSAQHIPAAVTIANQATLADANGVTSMQTTSKKNYATDAMLYKDIIDLTATLLPYTAVV